MTEKAEKTKNSVVKRIIVVGGGVIGCSTAYYLCQHENVHVTIVEKCEVACAASGKAGGFLAYDMCDNLPTECLARKSYLLHKEFGLKHADETFYREMNTFDVVTEHKKNNQTNSSDNNNKQDEALNWFQGDIKKCQCVGTTKTSAQVHPKLFCQSLIRLAKETNRLQVINGDVTNIIYDKKDDTTVIAIQCKITTNNNQQQSKDITKQEEKESTLTNTDNNNDDNNNNDNNNNNNNNNNNTMVIECNDIVICMGPWSSEAYKWFPKCQPLKNIWYSKHNSIVIESQDNLVDNNVKISNTALFLNHTDKNGKTIDCEVYPRSNHTIYVCGHAKQVPIPNNANLVHEDIEISNQLFETFNDITNYNDKAYHLSIKQACYLPKSKEGVPLIGRITGTKNAFLGAGHSSWGILLGPVTGLILSEMIICDKVECVDENLIKVFDPSQY